MRRPFTLIVSAIFTSLFLTACSSLPNGYEVHNQAIKHSGSGFVFPEKSGEYQRRLVQKMDAYNHEAQVIYSYKAQDRFIMTVDVFPSESMSKQEFIEKTMNSYKNTTEHKDMRVGDPSFQFNLNGKQISASSSRLVVGAQEIEVNGQPKGSHHLGALLSVSVIDHGDWKVGITSVNLYVGSKNKNSIKTVQKSEVKLITDILTSY